MLSFWEINRLAIQMYRRVNFLFSYVIAALLASCGNAENNGEYLAKHHCASCHAFADPSLLDKKTWESGVLPEMKFRMGMDLSRLHYRTETELKAILQSLPTNPLLTDREWKLIQEYYINHAPDTLRPANGQPLQSLQQFVPSLASLAVSGNTAITMIEYDRENRHFFLGSRTGKLYQLTSRLVVTDSFQLHSPPSDILFDRTGQRLVAGMGIMDPNDQPAGSIIRLQAQGVEVATLIDSLTRPVDLQQADFNTDGQQDLVVSEFGNFSGRLSLFENDREKYHKHVIHNFPGTRKTIIEDFNRDGLPDILALIAQGNEQIALFTNRGNFRFSFQVLLQFPPVYGSSYFEIHDFNHDDSFDILYTNGDNADYSTILKPYHGVRIFLNDKKNHFKESWFYSMPGASMAKAADFDQDGDLDIAAISFFPDFKIHPEHSFMYFKNEGGSFIAHSTPLAAASRWITLETADIDQDEDLDVVLGALAFPSGVPDSLYQAWRKKETSLLILKNNHH